MATSPVIKSKRRKLKTDSIQDIFEDSNVFDNNINNNVTPGTSKCSFNELNLAFSDISDNDSPVKSKIEILSDIDKNIESPSTEQQHDEAMGEKTTKQAKKSLITKSSHSNFGDKEKEHKKLRGKSIVWDLAEEYGSEEQFQTSETFSIIISDYAKHRNRNGVINYVCKYAKKKVREALKKTNMHNNIVIFRVSFIKKKLFSGIRL